MKQTLRRLTFALVLSLLAARASGADADWQLVSIENREYLSLSNIARFYQLRAEQNPADRRWALTDTRTRLETCSNPRELYINGVKHWLAFPVVSQKEEAFVSRLDLAKTIEPSLRPTMIGNLGPFHTVVLDAGHGGQDNGSRSLAGQEKEYTLDAIKRLRTSLVAKGFNVVLTRSDDNYMSLDSRADLANHAAGSIFVSVHFNSSGDASAKGFEVYAMTPCGAASTSDATVTPEQFKQLPGNDFDSASLALATCVHHSILGHLADNDRGVRRARFAVLRLTHAPAILVEGGFLSNGVESREINDPAWREKLADSIATGIAGYQRIAECKETPKLMADYLAEMLPGPASLFNTITLAANLGSAGDRLMPVSNPRQ